MKSRFGKGAAALALGAVALVSGAGCSQPVQSTPESSAQITNQEIEGRIQAIQNNAQMPPDAKQRAIAQLKAQQAASTGGQTGTSKP